MTLWMAYENSERLDFARSYSGGSKSVCFSSCSIPACAFFQKIIGGVGDEFFVFIIVF